jgi:hypothetical protein
VWGSWHHKWWEPIIQQYTAVSQKTRIHSPKNSDKYPSKIMVDILLTKYFYLMYQVYALTVHGISHHFTPTCCAMTILICLATTCWGKVITVVSCTVSAISSYIKLKYWFKVHEVNNFKILPTTILLWLCTLVFYVKHTKMSFQFLMKYLQSINQNVQDPGGYWIARTLLGMPWKLDTSVFMLYD